MKTPNVNPAFTARFVVPNAGSNKKNDYLYNNLSKIVKKNQVTANFQVDKVEILADKTQDKKITKALKNLDLTFFKDEKLFGDKNLFAKLWLEQNK